MFNNETKFIHPRGISSKDLIFGLSKTNYLIIISLFLFIFICSIIFTFKLFTLNIITVLYALFNYNGEYKTINFQLYIRFKYFFMQKVFINKISMDKYE